MSIIYGVKMKGHKKKKCQHYTALTLLNFIDIYSILCIAYIYD